MCAAEAAAGHHYCSAEQPRLAASLVTARAPPPPLHRHLTSPGPVLIVATLSRLSQYSIADSSVWTNSIRLLGNHDTNSIKNIIVTRNCRHLSAIHDFRRRKK